MSHHRRAFAAARAALAALLLAITAGASAAEVDGGAGRGFTVVNAGSRRIRAVYVSPSSSPNWGGNLLGEGLAASEAAALRAEGLRPGGRVRVRVTGECGTFDVRLVAENGTEFIEEEVELCDDEDLVTIGASDLKRARRDGSAVESR
jgi:hypothetical protein